MNATNIYCNKYCCRCLLYISANKSADNLCSISNKRIINLWYRFHWGFIKLIKTFKRKGNIKVEMSYSLPKQRQGQRIHNDTYMPRGLRKTHESVYVVLSNNLLPNNISIFPARFTRIILLKDNFFVLCFSLEFYKSNCIILWWQDPLTGYHSIFFGLPVSPSLSQRKFLCLRGWASSSYYPL